jgi:hypothetical protein
MDGKKCHMNVIVKVILAIYNFFVGDIVILIGVTATMLILALINTVDGLEPLRNGMGAILIVGVLATLVLSEARGIALVERSASIR